MAVAEGHLLDGEPILALAGAQVSIYTIVKLKDAAGSSEQVHSTELQHVVLVTVRDRSVVVKQLFS
jgi:hypothetical protein